MTGPAWWEQVVTGLAGYHAEHPGNLPGAVAAAETPSGGTLVTSVGAGWSADTIANVGSMTKTFTATAVLMALEDSGRLDVELPVHTVPGMEALGDDPAKRRIRVRHLLQHTSGLPVFLRYEDAPPGPCNDPAGPPPAGRSGRLGPVSAWLGSPGYTNELIRIGDHCRPARESTLDEVSEHLMRTYPLVHEPGAQYTYSSVNYVLAGRLVERLTGMPLNRYLRDRLFSPLGMRDSFFVADASGDATLDEGVTDAQRDRIAEVSLITRDGRWPSEVAPGPDGNWDRLRRGWRYVYPDGGLYSTAADLMSYLRMVRDGGAGAVSPAVHRLLVTDHGHGHTMAFGYRGGPTPYGQGPGTLEHLGNIMTYFWYDPRPAEPVLGVFLSQRLANALVDNNMTDGMRVIFRVVVPLISRAGRVQAGTPR
jgi:CubicO group peptidase (beta-lactamase class C family)